MATKSKYYRVRPQEEKNEEKADTDILLKSSPSYGKYISRALTLFFGEDKKFVTIKAAQRVIERAFWVAEVLKRKVPGLHQITQITEKQVVDVFEPKEQGLLRVQKPRYLTLVQIVLTLTPTTAQKQGTGYQTPIPEKETEGMTKEKWEEREKEIKQKRENKDYKPPRRDDRNDRQETRTRGRRQNRRD